MSTSPLIRLDDVSKIYHLESEDVFALDHVSLDIEENEFVAIMGPSGSGKSTMMNLLGILDVPTTGVLSIAGRNVASMTTLERTHMRRDIIGYIFQKFYLIPLLSAYENVEYPLILKHKKRDTTGRAKEFLDSVGIDEAMSAHRPNQLSGGQQQRVAIARALVNDPKILLCDEPTGNLDRKTGRQIMDILVHLHETGKTVIIVTHDPKLAEYAHRTIVLEDGRIVSIMRDIFFDLSVRSVRLNFLRSVLASVGIVIGVVAISAMGMLGANMQLQVKSQLSSNANTIVISPDTVRMGPPGTFIFSPVLLPERDHEEPAHPDTYGGGFRRYGYPDYFEQYPVHHQLGPGQGVALCHGTE